MKKYIKFIICILLYINVNSQVTEIVPLGTIGNYNNGVYYKDMTNELDPYVGTYEGIVNNKKYIFVLEKFVQLLDDSGPPSYDYRDQIKAKFKVIDLVTNTVLYSNLNATNPNDYLIYSITKPRTGLFTLYFKDTYANCQNSMRFSFKGYIQSNTIQYSYFSFDDWWFQDVCSFTDRSDIPVYLPQQDFILTKI